MSLYRSIVSIIAVFGLSFSALAAETVASPKNATAPHTQGAAQKMNVNTASAKELATLKGLPFSKARSIVSYRKKHGNFKSLDDLKSVKALKKLDEKTLKEIQDQLTVG